MGVLVRAAVLAASVAAAAWLALGLRSAELHRDAIAVAARAPGDGPTAMLAQARDDLRAARVAVPDGVVQVAEATLLARHGRRAEARAAAERLVRLEPANPVMWLLLSRAPVSDERRAQARAVIRRLAPSPAR